MNRAWIAAAAACLLTACSSNCCPKPCPPSPCRPGWGAPTPTARPGGPVPMARIVAPDGGVGPITLNAYDPSQPCSAANCGDPCTNCPCWPNFMHSAGTQSASAMLQQIVTRATALKTSFCPTLATQAERDECEDKLDKIIAYAQACRAHPSTRHIPAEGDNQGVDIHATTTCAQMWQDVKNAQNILNGTPSLANFQLCIDELTHDQPGGA